MEQEMNSSRPQMTPEENEQVMKFLSELEKMESENPEQFAQVMAQLGLGAEGTRDDAKGGISNAKNVVEAIAQMRSAASQGLSSAGSKDDIQLPDGKTMSNSGIRSKQKGIEITPEKGFVVKTKRMTDDLKVFINICKHSALGEPALKKKLDANGEEVEGMNIPLSVGPRRLDKDKSGVQCHVYDVIVNPKVIDDVVEDITGKKRDFLCQLAIQGLEQKYKENFDKRYKLPKLKYLGDNVEKQLIQDRKSQPVIEEISVPSVGKKKKTISKTNVTSAQKDEELTFNVYWQHECASGKSPEETLIPSLQRDAQGSLPPYVEPLTPANPQYTHILFTTHIDMSIMGSNMKDINVKISPFKLFVSVKGYKPVSLHLPAAVLPPSSTLSSQSSTQTFSVLRPVEGYARLVQLRIAMAIDKNDWCNAPDPGSKAWLIAEALGGGITRDESVKQKVVDENIDENTLPEDKFHIQLPDNVDKYTGLPLNEDNDELPEDKFHKADASSNYIIEQRENDIKKKWEKHAKEKAEMEKDPNVEFVELDDYKPGGKYGPEKDPTSKALDITKNAENEKLKKASEVLTDSMKHFDWSKEPDIDDIDIDDDVATPNAIDKLKSMNTINRLSSTLWTELLD